MREREREREKESKKRGKIKFKKRRAEIDRQHVFLWYEPFIYVFTVKTLKHCLPPSMTNCHNTQLKYDSYLM